MLYEGMWEGGGILPPILYFGTRCMYVVSVTPWPTLPRGLKLWYPLNRGCVGPRTGLVALEKSKISFLYWKLNNNFWVVKLWPSISTDRAVSAAVLQWSCVHVEPVILGAPNGCGLLPRNLLFPEHNSILTFYSLDLGNTTCLNMVPAPENRINIKIDLCCNFSGFRVTELQLVLSETVIGSAYHFRDVYFSELFSFLRIFLFIF